MNLKQAINRADALRPNLIPDEMKASWINDLDCRIAELMGKDAPADVWPQDRTLLMPAPCDSIYEFYLMAMIDLAQQDSALYFNDMTVFNSLYTDAKCWYRRNHKPKASENWRVM